jgi:hypothetical protein
MSEQDKVNKDWDAVAGEWDDSACVAGYGMFLGRTIRLLCW